MKAPSRLLAQTGIVVAVAAALLGITVSQASAFSSPEMPGRRSQAGPSRPSPEEPLETQIEQAIEEVNQEGQDALEELGELDTPEKVDRAEQILQHLADTSYEIRKRAHNRAADRSDELNDLAIGRLGDEERAELRAADTPEKRARAEAIRARNALIKAQLEDRWENQRRRWAQRQSERELPQADFRLPNGRPPIFAGLRLGLKYLTEEQADQAIARLETDSQNALQGLGELDTPGKVQRARNMRATLARRLQDLRRGAASQSMDAAGDQRTTPDMDLAGDQYEQRAHELQHRAEVAINGLGKLDTPEKQELARQINAKLEEALADLRERLSNPAGLAYQERMDREVRSLQRRSEAALEELGELDTPERQEKARRIQARLASNALKLREQLARRSPAVLDEGFDRDSDGLRRGTEVALQELGRLDTREKVQQARLIRVRMAEAINRLRNQKYRHLEDESGPRSDALTAFPNDRGQGSAADRRRDEMDAAERRDRAESARQAMTPEPDRPRPAPERGTRPTASTRVAPTVTAEPREVIPAENDSTSGPDASGSDGERNQ